MSTNKLKYWSVTTTQVIKANNKADAVAMASRKRIPGAEVVGTVRETERISAADATAFLSVTV
jgi:hypothetical protein